MGNSHDSMFAVVGKRLQESENIYETIQSFSCEIERELRNIPNLRDTFRHSKQCHGRLTEKKRSKPIVIYEEPVEPLENAYVFPFPEGYEEDDGYEMVDSEFLTRRPMNGAPLPSVPTSKYVSRPSSSTLINQPKETGATPPAAPHKPIQNSESYQTRMEAIAKKVSFLKGRGQLKLSVYVNCGLLTIHVMQARHLTSRTMLNCNTYVKLSLVPDDIRRTHCKTDLIFETNNPLFDEKFSFELLEGDEKKRLLISVWNRDENKGRSEFLGCMSFGINHIESSRRVVNGWYYLLAEEVGRRKHLRVVDKKSAPTLTDRSAKDVSPSTQSGPHWMDRHIAVVRRSSSGFGFTVSGTAPVQVCKVEAGSCAEAAGLRKDDCIVRINGRNVSQATPDSVARLVRHSSKQVILEVQRPRVIEQLLASPWKPALCSTFLPSPNKSNVTAHSDDDTKSQDSSRSSSPLPLRLEDLDENEWCFTGSGGSTGFARSGDSGRYYRESLV